MADIKQIQVDNNVYNFTNHNRNRNNIYQKEGVGDFIESIFQSFF